MTSYDKPHLTYTEQSALLKSRGLVVNDEEWFALFKINMDKLDIVGKLK